MPILGPPISPYVRAGELIRELPAALRDDRADKGLSFAQQAKLIGVGTDTLQRLDAGSNPTQTTLLACFDYLARG